MIVAETAPGPAMIRQKGRDGRGGAPVKLSDAADRSRTGAPLGMRERGMRERAGNGVAPP